MREIKYYNSFINEKLEFDKKHLDYLSDILEDEIMSVDDRINSFEFDDIVKYNKGNSIAILYNEIYNHHIVEDDNYTELELVLRWIKTFSGNKMVETELIKGIKDLIDEIRIFDGDENLEIEYFTDIIRNIVIKLRVQSIVNYNANLKKIYNSLSEENMPSNEILKMLNIAKYENDDDLDDDNNFGFEIEHEKQNSEKNIINNLIYNLLKYDNLTNNKIGDFFLTKFTNFNHDKIDEFLKKSINFPNKNTLFYALYNILNDITFDFDELINKISNNKNSIILHKANNIIVAMIKDYDLFKELTTSTTWCTNSNNVGDAKACKYFDNYAMQGSKFVIFNCNLPIADLYSIISINMSYDLSKVDSIVLRNDDHIEPKKGGIEFNRCTKLIIYLNTIGVPIDIFTIKNQKLKKFLVL